MADWIPIELPEMPEMPEIKEPYLLGLIDEDILERFKDSSVMYGDIINAQLIKTNRELIDLLKEIKTLK